MVFSQQYHYSLVNRAVAMMVSFQILDRETAALLVVNDNDYLLRFDAPTSIVVYRPDFLQ